MKPNRTDATLAKTYGCCQRTIRRWRAEKAPLSSPARMRAWLAARKIVPERTPVTLPVSSLPPEVGPTGVAGTLHRLELAEEQAYSVLQAAVKTGDPLGVRIARQNFLSIADSLRKYDAAIAEQRRLTGGLVARSEVVHGLQFLGYALRIGLGGAIPQAAQQLMGATDLPSATAILEKLFLNGSLVSYGAVTAEAMKLPPWIVQAFFEDFRNETGATSTDLERWRLAIEELMKHLAGQILPAPSTEPKL